jgi:cellulose synthase/poly-beta-1,6-N-acetylglucosamine synthase-like glycosyltransferase
MPKTKPKACNYGLAHSTGEYVVIYDAEDKPEPDQLKKAVAAFRANPDKYICFRSEIVCFNRNENILTGMSAQENTGWNRRLLQGLLRAGMPAPFGGAGSHFDVRNLKKIGAWDPFNVSDDADLGIRAFAGGYRAGVLDSVIHEEACSTLSAWINQHARRLKGYLQTFLVHSRHPLKEIKTLGPARWIGSSLFTGGMPAVFLLYPVLWLMFGLSLSGLIDAPAWLLSLQAANLLAVNIAAIIMAVPGTTSRKINKRVSAILLCPLYVILQSMASYKGLWQLFFRPFYWQKTPHGITKDVPVSQTLYIPEDVQELVVVKDRR